MNSHAIYMITDARFLQLGRAQSNHLAAQWNCDVHLFVEAPELEVVMPVGNLRVKIHLNKLEAVLPENIPVSSKWPRVVFLRNYAPQLLSDYDRIMYLDIDILSRKADPSIWALDLPAGIGAVSDSATLHKAPIDTGLEREEWLERIGVTSGHYFNAGVLLIDPARWDCEMLERKLDGYFDNRNVRAIKSQDFLNHALDGVWTELSPRWNYQPPFFELGLDERIDPVFVHFCNHIKPWFFPGHPGASNERIYHEEAFFMMMRAIEVDPREVAELHHMRPAKQLLRRFRAFLSERGVILPKEKQLRQFWSERKARLIRHMQEATVAGRFADRPDLDLDLPQTESLRFDGQKLWLNREKTA